MQIKSKIKLFIVENFLLGDSEDEIEDGALLVQSGIVDSIGILELVDFIENEFNIHVEDHELVPENFASVNHLEDFLYLKMAAAKQQAENQESEVDTPTGVEICCVGT